MEEGGKGTFAMWAKRHIDELNKMIETGVPPTSLRTALKRILVLDPSFRDRKKFLWAQFPQKKYPIHDFDSSTLLSDVDGRWYLPGELRENSGYYDYRKHYDIGLVHELGHYLLGLQDLYIMNFKLSGRVKTLIPDDCRTYFGGEFLMKNSTGIDMFHQMYLERSRKDGIYGRNRGAYERHSKLRRILIDYLPASAHVSIKSPNGALMRGAAYRLMRLKKTHDYGDYIEDSTEVLHEGVLSSSGSLALSPRSIFSQGGSEVCLNSVLVITGSDGRNYNQVLTPIPFAIKQFSGEDDAKLTINFEDVDPTTGVSMTDEKGRPIFTDGQVFLYEDEKGEPIKNERGSPVMVKLGERGEGVYRLIDIGADGYEIAAIDPDFLAYSKLDRENREDRPRKSWMIHYAERMKIQNPFKLWYRGGASRWSFENSGKIKKITAHGQTRSVIPLPYNQSLVHRFTPDIVLVEKDENGGDNFDGFSMKKIHLKLRKI